MALVDTTWYCNFGNGTSTGYYAVTVRPQNTAVAAGVLRRQFTAPAVGSERVFVCIVAGTTANVADATWVLTRGAKTTDGTATWQECSGQAALNGDLTNTATWAQVKAATPAVLGQIIKRSNNASYQICTTAGAMSASEPAFSDTAGVTTTDTTAVWTSLGLVGNFTGGQAPHARLANVFGGNWFAAGNTAYVGANHAESQATALSFATAGNTAGAFAKILCHNQSGAYPPAAGDLTTGASVSTTAASGATLTVTTGGSLFVSGIAFKSGSTTAGQSVILLTSSGAATNQTTALYENCSFQITSATSTAVIQVGNLTGYNNVVLNNCTVKFAAVSQFLFFSSGQFVWKNTGPVLESGSTMPSVFISFATGNLTYDVILEALDLSQITSSLISFSATTSSAVGSVLIKDCKLNAAATIGTPVNNGYTVQLVRSSA